MIGRLGLIVLVVGDLGRSVWFYRDLLGLTVRHATSMWTELDAGNVRLALHTAGEDVHVTPTTGCTFAFFVSDAEDIVQRLRAGGVLILHEPHREDFGVSAVISDPDGYRIQLLELARGKNNRPEDLPQSRS
jgi:lactoylglutathione lyase